MSPSLPIPRVRARFVSLAVLAIAISAVTLLPASSSASQLPGLLTQLNAKHPFSVRPAVVDYTGDASGFLGGFDGTGTDEHFGHLSWSTWTSHTASGTGAVWLNECEPSCAQGRFSPFAVKVHAFAPHQGHFTRLTLSYEYQGKVVVDRRGILRNQVKGTDSGSYQYYIVSTSAAGSRFTPSQRPRPRPARS